MKPIKNISSPDDGVPIGSVWKPVPGGTFALNLGNVRVTDVAGKMIWYHYERSGLAHGFSQHIIPFTFYSRRVIA